MATRCDCDVHQCLRSRRNANSVSAASAVGARRASGQVFKHDSRSEHRQDRRVPNDTVEATLTPAVASLHNSALSGARPFVVAQTGAAQVAHVWIVVYNSCTRHAGNLC